MSTIRAATADDIPALCSMGRKFLAISPYAKTIALDSEELSVALTQLMETGCVLVCEVQGQVVGGIVGAISSPWFAPTHSIAIEMAWWMQPEHRSGTKAVRLWRAFEAWAEEHGAKQIAMSDLIFDDTVAQMYERMGYRLAERAYIKEG